MIDYKAKPYNLDEKGIHWVEETFAGMTQEEKLGQIFIQLARPDDRIWLDERILQKKVGGILFRAGQSTRIREAVQYMQERTKIPLLCCANLEEGGIGLLKDGTCFSKQMGVAATGNPDFAYKSGKVSASEAGAVGCRMNFGPVVDMCIDWHSAITNTNSFGSDPEKVYTFAAANMRGLMEEGMAACIKHFPGEGQDDRDQHYQCEMNEMSTQEWDRTFGKIFQKLFDDGAMAVMPGHIALPSYQEKYGENTESEVLPATFSKALLTDLLRGQMHFNGLCISDTTTISGFTCYLPRYQALPRMVEAGIDLILYSMEMEEDLQYLRDGLENGLLTQKRLDEAVKRILAVKAALGLPALQRKGELVPPPSAMGKVRCAEHGIWAGKCADQAVTLVKDTQHLLPVRPEERRRVYVILLVDEWEREDMSEYIRQALEMRGFEAHIMDPQVPDTDGVEKWKAKCDWRLYIGRVESAHKDKTVLRLNWSQTGQLAKLTCDIPTVYVSFGNPFDLYDVPMMKTYINAYTGTHTVIDAVLDKLTGKSGFKGISPVDPFCGRRYARL